jgi:hypothetical protein
MHITLTKRQKNYLKTYLEDIKEDDNKKMTKFDYLLEYFIDLDLGVLSHGKNIKDICNDFNINYKTEFREVQRLRSSMCQFALNLIKDGFPFGALKKDKGLKKYGWIKDKKEFLAINNDKTISLIKQVKSKIHLFKNENIIKQKANELVNECEKQLELWPDFKQ